MPSNDLANGTSKSNCVSTAAATEEEPAIGRQLWQHPAPETTKMHAFKQHISRKYGVVFGTEEDAHASLWRWSVDNIPDFWAEAWNACGIRASRRFDDVRTCLWRSYSRRPLPSL
jgi:hypothetical protein